MTSKQRRRLNKRVQDRKLFRALKRGVWPLSTGCQWVPVWLFRRIPFTYTGEVGKIEGVRWMEV